MKIDINLQENIYGLKSSFFNNENSTSLNTIFVEQLCSIILKYFSGNISIYIDVRNIKLAQWCQLHGLKS